MGMTSRPVAERVPAVLAGFLTAVALLAAGAAVVAAWRPRLHAVEAWTDWVMPAPPNLAYAALIAIFAAAAARRKRAAWWILGVYFLLTACLDVLVAVGLFTLAHRPELLAWQAVAGAVIGTAAVVLLVIGRKAFVARTRRFAVWEAVGTFLGCGAVAVAAGWGLLELFPGTVPADDRLGYAAQRILGGALRLQISGDGSAPGGVNFLLGLFGAVVILISAWVLLRSRPGDAAMSEADEARVRSLLSRWGADDSLGYFATRRDKAVLFESKGNACIAYRVEGGVCLAAGDPVGNPDAWPRAIAAWLDQARDFGWAPAVLGASEAGAAAFARAGMIVIEIGDEAVLLPGEYTLDGSAMKPVRQAVHRVERAGYTVQIRRQRDVPEDELARVSRLADDWRDTDEERGFSMALGRIGDLADEDCVLVTAHAPDGGIGGLLSFVPFGKRGLGLDLMRRSPQAPNGIVEFMVTESCRFAAGSGIDKVSLNFAMFRSVFERGARIGAGPVIRGWRRILLWFSRWWQLESLYRSNVKYGPAWVPRFLCYGERRSLGRVVVAAGRAEGFVRRPHFNGTWGPPVALLVAAIAYCAWMLGPLLNPALDPLRTYASALVAVGAPHARVFQVFDLLAGALALGAALAVRRRLPGWWALALFGAATVLDSTIARMGCHRLPDGTCEAAMTWPHIITSTVSSGGLALAALIVALEWGGRPAWILLAAQLLTGSIALGAEFGLALPGLTQRLELLTMSIWLIWLAWRLRTAPPRHKAVTTPGPDGPR